MERPRLVIGVDPGLASTGYGLIRTSAGRISYLFHGVIKTESKLTRPERLLALYNAIVTILREYRPDEAGMETLFFSRNATSALPVAEARGVISLAIAQTGIPLFEYSPNAIKQSATGNARAEKSQVQEMLRIILGLPEIPKPDHASDALGAALCHINNAAALRA